MTRPDGRSVESLFISEPIAAGGGTLRVPSRVPRWQPGSSLEWQIRDAGDNVIWDAAYPVPTASEFEVFTWDYEALTPALAAGSLEVKQG